MPHSKKSGFIIVGSIPKGGKHHIDLKGKKTVLVIGNEAEGISPDIVKICDECLSVPGFGKAESLNAAVSAGIIMNNLSELQYNV